MGVISILLGIISFLLFTAGGAILSGYVVDWIRLIGMAYTPLANVNGKAVVIGVVGVFAFVGLLTGVSLIMLGLNYNKLTRIQNTIKRR